MLIKVVLFAAISVGLTWVSRRSLQDRHSHGFCRFFAWEAILALILLNIEHWFSDPFSPSQLISWLLLVISAYLVIDGVWILHRMGKPSRTRIAPMLYDLEKTTELVTTGIYRYIRHPIYGSLVLLAWGVFFKNPELVPLCLGATATGFLLATAKAEEAENIRYFGAAYREYISRTRMFVPYLF